MESLAPSVNTLHTIHIHNFYLCKMAEENTWIMVSFLCHFAQHILMQPAFILNPTILPCSIPYLSTHTTFSKFLIF